MKDLNKAEDYMKTLYASLGYEWKPTFFHKTWTSNLYGQDWDRLYQMGMVRKDLCAICGNDELISGYYRIPAFSQYKVQIPYCDECFMQATGGNVPINPIANRSGCFGIILIFTIVFTLLTI